MGHNGSHKQIGIEIPGIYDGILFWYCTDCGVSSHRWPEGHHLHAVAEPYVGGGKRFDY